jgi:hypothetical protein
MEELNLNITGDQKELVVRTGMALPLQEPVVIEIDGQINSVLKYLEKRVSKIDEKQCFIEVDKDDYFIQLYLDEKNFYADSVRGKIQLSKIFKDFGINSEKTWTPFELADFIRMHKTYFEKPNDAANLVKQLRNFELKVNNEINQSGDKRGNQKMIQAQAVESNLPKSFKVKIPVFKGIEKETLPIEVDIDATSFNCRLVSPEAKEIEQNTSEGIIDEQIQKITELCPDIVIINL